MSLDPKTGGGTAERTLQVSRSLAKSGEKCTILTLDIGVTDSLQVRADEARIVVLPCRFERYYVPASFRTTLPDLIASTDIVQIMNHWTMLNALIFHYIRRSKKPYVVCPAGALPLFGRSKISKHLYNGVVGKRIIRNADACVAVSPTEISDFKSYGASDERISVIPNGVDPGEFIHDDDREFRRKYGLRDVPFILFMGRLNAIKGPDLLLEAFINAVRTDRFPHHLVFAGPDGGMLHELRSNCLRAGIGDKVHFIGYVGGVEKSNAYHAADFLVIPSRQEAMSIVVLEAGITGTPVLITDRCGFDDVAGTGGGKVVPASGEGLEKGLVFMMSNGEALKTMGKNLKKFTSEHFLWDRMAKSYLELFSKILHERHHENTTT